MKDMNKKYGRICSWIDRSFLFILITGFILFLIELYSHPEYGGEIAALWKMNGEQIARLSSDSGMNGLLLAPSYRLLYFSIILFASAVGISLLALSILFFLDREYAAFIFSFLTVLSILAAASGSFISG